MTAAAAPTDVVVVGAGPVGLMLAGELARAGVGVVVLERRDAPTTASRASTLHARTMEILDSRGLLPRFGSPPAQPRGHFGGIPMDLTLPSSHPGQWKVPQTSTESVLQQWALALGADIRRGVEVVEVVEEPGQARVRAVGRAGEADIPASYVVACDGEDSTVRRLLRADFPGQDAVRELLRADVAGIEVRDRRFERLEAGLAIAARRADGVTRVMVHAFGARVRHRDDEPAFEEISTAWKQVTGEDISAGTPLWTNSFGDAARQLTRYRHGRILFAGDAAHRQMPIGGQALNLGLQDAFNLGWKLAAVIRGDHGPELLDSYHDERHAVGAGVLSNIRAQALLLLGGIEVEPLREVLAEMIGHEEVRTRLAGMISGLDIRYAMGGGADPLLGARLPPSALRGAQDSVTTAALLRRGGGLLLDLGARPVAFAGLAGWRNRVTVVRARAEPGSALDVPAHAVLVRPDGHVAWTSEAEMGLTQALTRWFGPPADRP
ncbi:FAD-dependent oxidoreductase [Streptomyces sp. Tu 4128]|uniref:FAD-dependent oxidoreductase n=1 Tax=Streptomyces sp. Tu 4128 TaxID=1120314 RepID=UPI0013CF2C91|nr:FAD-dependent oxidoreductase [Streptomyces sp. Tu 4128]